jgi:cytochrome c oxidase subunit 3
MSAHVVAVDAWRLPSRGRVGMWCLIAAESAIFTIFVVAYLFYIGKSQTGPKPADVLHAPILYTICLLSSSLTIHISVRRIAEGKLGAFALWWIATILLGGAFLFGTTYYSLVGLHAFHVTMGLLALTLVASFYFTSRLRREHSERLEVLSMYWHFVDAVWIVVFTVVYMIGA